MTIFLIAFSFLSFAQNKIVGRYCNSFGSCIELNEDSTFKYIWNFDLVSSWTKGKWFLKNDTIYFQVIPIYDTISYKNNDGTSADKLILSVDEIPERLTPEKYTYLKDITGGQNIQSCPSKLFFKKQKFYYIKNGKLVMKKSRTVWSKKKIVPWYFKKDG